MTKRMISIMRSILLGLVIIAPFNISFANPQTIALDGSGVFLPGFQVYGESGFIASSSTQMSLITSGGDFLGINSLSIVGGSSFDFVEASSALNFNLLNLNIAPVGDISTQVTIRGLNNLVEVANSGSINLPNGGFTNIDFSSLVNPATWNGIDTFKIDSLANNVDIQLNNVQVDTMIAAAPNSELTLFGALLLSLGFAGSRLLRRHIRFNV